MSRKKRTIEIVLMKQRERALNKKEICRKQFPDCPPEMDNSCKICPFYKKIGDKNESEE